MQTKDSTSQRKTNRGARAAFTLIELLVVVAIMVLAMGALLPTLKGFFDSAGSSDARNLITANLTGARNYAVANSVTTALVFVQYDLKNKPLRTLMFLAESGDGTSFAPVPGQKPIHLPDKIILSQGNVGSLKRNATISFLPTGQLTELTITASNITWPDLLNNPDLIDSPPNSVVPAKSFYLYDATDKKKPKELEYLSINYYTGAVIKNEE